MRTVFEVLEKRYNQSHVSKQACWLLCGPQTVRGWYHGWQRWRWLSSEQQLRWEGLVQLGVRFEGLGKKIC